jgi:hypothetical protein
MLTRNLRRFATQNFTAATVFVSDEPQSITDKDLNKMVDNLKKFSRLIQD